MRSLSQKITLSLLLPLLMSISCSKNQTATTEAAINLLPSLSSSATPHATLSPSASPLPSASASPTFTATPSASATPVPSLTPTPTPRISGTGTALILYDGAGTELNRKFAMMYGVMIQNLLGHFDMPVELMQVEDYRAGKLEFFPVTFYFGSYSGNPLPAAFLSDVMTTTKKIVWFKYNIWQLAAANLNNGFVQKFGASYQSVRTLNAAPSATNPNPGFFDTVLYKNKSLVKYYQYSSQTGTINADPDIGVLNILDPAKASAYAQIRNPATQETVPYITHSSNFWYMADIPFTYIGARDRYLVLCDALHDMLGINHPVDHKALVRLEDVNAGVVFNTMKALADFMHSASVPFSVATIPFYRDPLGTYNGGVADEIHLTNASVLKASLDYALTKGGSIVAHGYTHQYMDEINVQSGVSGDDFEFWNANNNSCVLLDSPAWALARVDAANAELLGSNYHPFAWEAPHYIASPTDYHAFTLRYGTTYQRVMYFSSETPVDINSSLPTRDLMSGLFYPYLIVKDSYGQRVIPENLGSISYSVNPGSPNDSEVITWQTLVGNADYGLIVRDGFASFFFHPYWLQPSLNLTTALSDFQSLVNGIKALGYTFVAAPDLASGLMPVAAKSAKTNGRMPASVKTKKAKTLKPALK